MWKGLHRQLRSTRSPGPTGPTRPTGPIRSLENAWQHGPAEGGASNGSAAPEHVEPTRSPGQALHGSTADHALPGHAPEPLPIPADLQARLDALATQHPQVHRRLQHLDAGQLAAVLSDDPAVLLRAPVGSGKTTVLVHRVLVLHVCHGVPLQRIALLTFTNRAAAELRQRIAQLFDAPLPDGALWLTGTFHRVACTLLRRALPIAQRGYSPDFSILDAEETDALLTDLIRAHRLRVGRRKTLRQRLRSVGSADSKPSDLDRLATLFAQAKRERSALSFDDLIDVATDLLSDCAADSAADPATDPAANAAADSPTENTAHGWLPQAVLVDEMQDCEQRDLALLRALRGHRASFFAVGDPYQAIYGFRGSAPSLFARAEADFACRTYALSCNYRSTRQIVDGARAVLGMQPAVERTAFGLRAVRGSGERIVIRRHHDPVAESLYLAERIARLLSSGVPARDIAVLFRLRAQAALVRQAMEARGLPCIEHDESPDLDDSDQATDHASSNARTEATRITHPPNDAAGTPDSANAEITRGDARSDGTRGDNDAGVDAPADARNDATAAAKAAAKADAVAGRRAPDADAVRLLTLHAAKGLEWRHVFLSGINQGLLPLGRGLQLDVAHDAEERRLLFVGITRARDRVEISYHARPHERTAVGDPSDFLAALPADVVDWCKANEPAPAAPPAPPTPAPPSPFATSSPAALPPTAATAAPTPSAATAAPSPAPATAAPSPSAAAAASSPPAPSPAASAAAAASSPPAPSPTTATVRAAAGAWQTGQAVRHPRYGVGVIVAVQGGTIDCSFGKLGPRSFPLSLCPLTPID